MRTKLYFVAALAATLLASCADDKFVGENSPNELQENAGVGIRFGFDMKNVTRGNIVGNEAAKLLGNGFYVTGTKGSEVTDRPSETLVFDNYLVYYADNTAGTTESNTANWEYVGVTPGTTPYTNWVKLATTATTQTIKYWDYSTAQYDFLAFSTGEKKAVSKTNLTGSGDNQIANDEIGVTKMKHGEGLKTPPAYTFYIPTIEALKNAYITDITTVENSNYGKEVTLQFKNLGSKVRVALYETVPGYSVKAGSVQFYEVDKSDAGVISSTDLGTGVSTDAKLISGNETYGFPQRGKIEVSFPNIGTSNTSNANYNKASVEVTPQPVLSPVEKATYQKFGTLAADKFATAEGYESPATASYLGRSLPQATYAGVAAVDYYQVVFPVTGANAKPLTLRVDYTLISTDGSGEEINVYGAKAVVPATYTVWQPNYAYTYVFKISDNTNGWTTKTATSNNQGLYPITFDAVVAEIKDVSGEQTTITTVATPTITTYQQNHDKTKDEYSKSTKGKDNVIRDLYVQVMNNTGSPAVLYTDLNGTTSESTARSLFYKVSAAGRTYDTAPSGFPTGYFTDADCFTPASSFSNVTTYYKACTEATVMDALQNRVPTSNITGRNGVTLAPNTNMTTTGADTKFDIVNGPDDKKITVNEGEAAKITMSTIAVGTYAYVYDYSTDTKVTTTFYQPNGAAENSIIPDSKKYITIAKLGTITEKTSGSEGVNDDYIYFSKTTIDGTNYTYSYYSVEGKTGNLPADLLKVNKNSDLLTGNGSDTKVTPGAFVFDIYERNNGKYAVKVIKIVA